MNTPETSYCSVAEAAHILQVSPPTVWRWVNSGRLPAYRVGARAIRIRRSDLGKVVRPARGPNINAAIMERNTIHVGDPTTPVDELIARLEAAQERILKRRRGKVLKPSDEVIRKAREERAARL